MKLQTRTWIVLGASAIVSVISIAVIIDSLVHPKPRKQTTTQTQPAASTGDNKPATSKPSAPTTSTNTSQPTPPANKPPSTKPTAPKSTGTQSSGSTTPTTPAAPTPPPPPVVPEQSCPAYPSFPGAACTGVPSAATLTAYNGTMTITQAGAVIDSLDITGGIIINAANVTIKNCKIHGSGSYGVQVQSGSVTIKDSELYGFSGAAISPSNWSAYRVDIHDVSGNGVNIGTNTLLQDSYLHDFSSGGPSSYGGQMQTGSTNVVIRHNWVNPLGGVDAALFLSPELGPSASGPITIDANLLGSGTISLNIYTSSGGSSQSGYIVTNNRFLSNSTTPANVVGPLANITSWSGNVYDDSGLPVNIVI